MKYVVFWLTLTEQNYVKEEHKFFAERGAAEFFICNQDKTNCKEQKLYKLTRF